jgi:lipopolysaccharide/colanic/teichoic acid biosynthesis glycosyltransferase
MLLQPLTTTTSGYSRGQEVVRSAFEKNEMTYYYIGSNPEISEFFSTTFKDGRHSSNYRDTISCIKTILHLQGICPDVILIDLPLNKDSLQDFCKNLKHSGVFANTVIIYNDANLSFDDISFLKQLDLIDDVANISASEANFANKVNFLKSLKTRAQMPQMYVSRSAPLEALQNGSSLFTKRMFDVLIAGFAILALLPLFVLIAIAIRMESRGPIFYTALRAGRGFKLFNFYKFRTMEVGADKKVEALSHLNQYGENENGAKFLKIYNDPRVTKVGKFLRNTSLDELPQLLNVLKGDMSLVGNRPLPIYEASTLTTDECVERFMAPAGITGLWQVKKRSNFDMSAEERINLDISYARKNNFMYDIWIIAQTPGALFQKTNV